MKRFILFLLVCFISFTLIGCGGDEESNTPSGNIDQNGNIIEDAPTVVTLPDVVNMSIDLPTSKDGYSISWSSNNNNVLNEKGHLFAVDEAAEVFLTATITKDGKEFKELHKVLVDITKDNPFKGAYGFYVDVVKSSYNKDAAFTYTKYRTFTPTFESLNPEVITNEGNITQLDHDQEATIRMTITDDATGAQAVYYVKTIITEWSKYTYVDVIEDWLDGKVKEFAEGTINELPSSHDVYPSKIEWVSGTHLIVTKDGKVIKPVEYVTDEIKCTITYGKGTDVYSKNVSYVLENIGGNSIENILDAWLPTLLPTEIIGHKNVVTANDFLDYQYETFDGAVLNFIDGSELSIDKSYYIDVLDPDLQYKNQLWTRTYHPAITNDGSEDFKLFEAYFGKGYQIPNEENICYIVVHESGMPGVGNDAELLADLQYRNVFTADSYREASWHYQVDEGKIYQSFPDTTHAWHAGGSYGKYLPYNNRNSIGIEMCINEDGNYDGAMANDAKLVANLMYNYNLTLKNVVRHYDTSGKICPNYMIETNRYEEFIHKVSTEYLAIKYLRNATVEWTVSHPELFEYGVNGLYYAKPVSENTEVTVTLKVTLGTYTYEGSSSFVLKPAV